MRASWQGYITLGQLGIPVRLYNATQSGQPRFVLLHEHDQSAIERPYRCAEEQRDVPYGETIRAVEYERGKYITISDRELEQSAIGPIKSIAIQQLTKSEAIPAIYYEKPYYAVPSKGGERAYALFREVFARTGTVAIAEFTLHAREHIGLLGLHGDLLMLHQLRFTAEITPRSSLKTPALPKPSPSEIEALRTVVERFSGPFYIEDYHDEYAEHIQELVERKAKGLKAPRRERPAPHATSEADILPTLQHALQEPQLLSSG
jgi:DNA end-binding protein Ku